MNSGLFGFHPSFSSVALRLVLGIIFIAHGYPKLFSKDLGPRGFSGFLQKLDVPAPLAVAYIVGVAEFFGGIALLLGLLTRLFAVLLSINMLVAMAKLKFRTGLVAKVMDGTWVGGYELDLALLTMLLVLFSLGSSRYSLDWILFQRW